MTDEPASRPSTTGEFQRPRVLALVALATLPLLLLAAVSAWRGLRQAEARVAEERAVLARAAAFLVNAFVDGNLATLRGLAFTPVLRDPTRQAELAALLEQILQTDPNWDVLGLADQDGWNVAITGLPPRTVNIASLDFFQQVQATGRPVVSPAFLGRVRGIPLIAVAVPVEFAGGQRGVLSGSLSLTKLEEELRSVATDPSIQIVLLDSLGQVFLHPNPDVARALTPIRGRAEVEAVLAGQAGTRLAQMDGAQTLVAYAPVPDTGWGVLVVQPTSAAFGPVRRQLAEALGLLAFTVMLTGLIGWHLGGRLARFYRRELEARGEAEAAAAALLATSAESEARRRFLENLIASAPVAIAVLKGPEHRYVTVNSRYEAIKPGVKLLGRTFSDVFPELTAQGSLEQLDQVYRTGQQVTTVDQPVMIDDGTEGAEPRYFTTVISRYDGPGGRPEGLLVVALETTDTVLARQRVEQKKDEFLSTASHELRTPIASLGLATQMIDRLLSQGSLDPARLERLMSGIRVQVARTNELIDDLLDVSRLEAGGVQVRRAPLDLAQLTRAAVRRERDTLSGDDHEILLEPPDPAPLPIEGDEARLDQVLTNLLSNAVKYSPDGGPIHVRLGADNGQAVLSVADHGIGIPPSERDDLFSPFGRTETARASGIEGTGLGLYIARRIVEAHGGTIDLSDTPGGGTTFTVKLPAASPDAPPAAGRTEGS